MATQVVSAKKTRGVVMDQILRSLPARVGLVILATFVLAGLAPLVFLINHTLSPTILKWAWVASLGIVAAFETRWLLWESRFIIKILVVISSLLINLGLLNRLTLGYIGLSMFPINASLSEWGQLAIGGALAWLALRIWPVVRTKDSPTKAASRPERQRAPRPQSSKRPAHTAPPRQPVRPSQSGWLRLKSSSGRLQHAWRQGTDQALGLVASLGKTLGRAINQPRRLIIRFIDRSRATIYYPKNRSRMAVHPPISPGAAGSSRRKSRTKVRLIGAIEHRCPYCLEPVARNDMRGVRICPVCHTLHHADCWEVTGTCQVPHYHS